MVTTDFTFESPEESFEMTMESLDPRVDELAERVSQAEQDIENLEENKVDKIEGKGLSTNDYTNEDKTKLTELPSNSELQEEFEEKVDKIEGKGLSTEDYTTEEKEKLDSLPSSEQLDNRLSTLEDDIDGIGQDLVDHINDKNNPHEVNKADVGLGNVDNTSDLNKPISTAMQEALSQKASAQDVADLMSYVMAGTSETNQLTNKDFVNSSVGTNTANFIGTFNSLEELEEQTGVTNNDYGFVRTTDSAGNVVFNRYKYNASQSEWKYEYSLNNSSFTQSQWSAINSGITAELVAQITTNKTAIAELVTALGQKASQSDLNALALRVGANETSIASLLTTVAGKLDKTALAIGENGDPKTLNQVDLNGITDTGFYFCNGCTNRPVDYNGVMIVTRRAGHPEIAMQMYFTFVSQEVYVRNRDSYTWSAWRKFVTSADISTYLTSYRTSAEQDVIDEKKADKDGDYSDDGGTFTFSTNLIDKQGAGTNQDIGFRATAGAVSIDNRVGRKGAVVQRIKGKSVKVSQLCKISSNPSKTGFGLTITNNNDGTYTLNGTPNDTSNFFIIDSDFVPIIGHSYYITIRNSNISNFVLYSINNGLIATDNIQVCTNNLKQGLCLRINGLGETYTDEKIIPMLFDLTNDFGAGNEPTTVAQYESWLWNNLGLTLDQYIEYGERVVNYKGTGLKSVFFNQYNGQPFKVLAQQYQITGTYTSLTLDGETITPDTDGKFTPSHIGTLTVVGGDNTTCVHLVHGGYRNGEYEPYGEDSISWTNPNFPDGMNGVGTVFDERDLINWRDIKRFGKVDLGTLTSWLYDSPNKRWTTVISSIKNVSGRSNDIVFTNYITDTSATVGDEGKAFHYSTSIFVYSNDSVNHPTGYLLYPLADSVITPITPFDNAYIADDFGTEESLHTVESTNLNADILYNIDYTREVINLPSNYVSATKVQNFTSSEKAQARSNIGALGSDVIVQSKGQDSAKVMSQKAVTDILDEEYELIETITLDEDVASIIREREPDTTPYKFKKILVKMEHEGQTNAVLLVAYNEKMTSDEHTYAYANPSTSTDKCYTQLSAYMENGYLLSTGVAFATGGNAQLTRYPQFNFYKSEYIAKIELRGYSVMQTGMTIQIYGVRI